MSDGPNLDAYLRRINYSGSIAPTLETLQMLHRLHPAAIPFETLTPMLGLPVRLGLGDLEQKLVVERRGGYCFEHNLLFKAVLEDMDFPVTPLAAAVLYGHENDDGFVPHSDHMALLVEAGGTSYLVDVGFGGQVATAPLRLRSGVEQDTPNERYRLLGGDPVWRLESEIAGTWRPLYQFDITPHGAEDYAAMNDAATAYFKDHLMAARVDGPTRFALLESRFRVHNGAETTTRMLQSAAELREVLANAFGIALPPPDQLDPVLDRVIGNGIAA